MASSTDIAKLRLAVDEPDVLVYTDPALSLIIDQAGSVDLAAVELWEQKAARYSSLVNTTESGSSRSMGNLYKQAQEMALYYRNKIVDSATPPSTTTSRSGTRTAERK